MEQFAKVAKAVDGIIVRFNLDELHSPDRATFTGLVQECVENGIPVWSYIENPENGQLSLGDFNGSCANISKFQAFAHPQKGISNIVGDDLVEATLIADCLGKNAIDAITMTAASRIGYLTPFETGPMVGILPQPSVPMFKLVVVEYNIPGHEGGVGGADKGMHCHRVDSIPIANGVIKTGNACMIIK